MRIIAGALKGRRLDSPDWPGLRPTSDKLRETLFNVLGARVADARVLDGYAGTGAVGIEALSRGAAEVTFVESNARAVRLIERNLGHCAVTDRHVIIRARFAEAARRWPDGVFDLILLDPPYGAADLEPALEAAGRLLGPEALLVIEHARRDQAPARAAPAKGSSSGSTPWAIVKTRDLISGDSVLSFYRVAGTGDAGLS